MSADSAGTMPAAESENVPVGRAGGKESILAAESESGAGRPEADREGVLLAWQQCAIAAQLKLAADLLRCSVELG